MKKAATGSVSNAYTDLNDFSSFYDDASIVAVPEKYLNVTFDEDYVYNDLQSGIETTETTNGKKDAIQLLYSDEEVDEYVTFPSNN